MKYPRRHRTHEKRLQTRDWVGSSNSYWINDEALQDFLKVMPDLAQYEVDTQNYYSGGFNKFDISITPAQAAKMYGNWTMNQELRNQVFEMVNRTSRDIPFVTPWGWSLQNTLIDANPDGMYPGMDTKIESRKWVRLVKAGGWYWKPVPMSEIINQKYAWAYHPEQDAFMDNYDGYAMYRLEHISGVTTDIYCNFIGYCVNHSKYGRHEKQCGVVMNVFVPPKYGLAGRDQDIGWRYHVNVYGCDIILETEVFYDVESNPLDYYDSQRFEPDAMNVCVTGSFSNKVVDLYDFEGSSKDSLKAAFDSAYKSNLSTKGVKTHGASSTFRLPESTMEGPRINGYTLYGVKIGKRYSNYRISDTNTPYPYEKRDCYTTCITWQKHGLDHTFNTECTNYPLDCSLIAPNYAKNRARCNDNYTCYMAGGGFVIDFREPVAIQRQDLKDYEGRIVNVLPFTLGDNIWCYLADDTLVFTQASSKSVVNVQYMWDKDRAMTVLVITSKKKTVTLLRYVSNDITIKVRDFMDNQYDIIKRDLTSYDVSFK